MQNTPGSQGENKNNGGANVRANKLYEAAQSHILRDGIDFVLDPVRSQGATLINALNGKDYINFHGGYRSNALGENHPGFTAQDVEKIARATINKQAHADIYTADQLQAIETISRLYMRPAGFEKAFFIDGGALAVENALKVALRNHALNLKSAGELTDDRLGKGIIIGLKGAFHGRSGMTMTLSRTDPGKSEFMPRWPWPSLAPPHGEKEVDACIATLKTLLADHHPNVAGLILEPIQCEGGDRLMPKRFFEALRALADEHNFYLIYDETQTGFYVTGKAFAFQALDLPAPDIVCGAKKSSIGYVFAGQRVLAVEGNAFAASSKINSTWGGHGGDYLVCARKLELIEQLNLTQHIKQLGQQLLEKLVVLCQDYPNFLVAPRGVGLLVAADCPSAEIRDALLAECFENRLLLLSGGVPGSGPFTLRFGPPLCVTEAELDAGMTRLAQALKDLTKNMANDSRN
jgi:L-lysine 6-transaminase